MGPNIPVKFQTDPILLTFVKIQRLSQSKRKPFFPFPKFHAIFKYIFFVFVFLENLNPTKN